MTTTHREVWDLIPWVVAGSAGTAQEQRVREHAAACADCRDELAFHQGVRDAMASDAAPVPGAEPALQRLMARIDTAEQLTGGGDVPRAAVPPSAPAHWLPSRFGRWLAAAVVVQTVGLATLTGMLLERPRPAAYQTLSRPAAAPGPAATIRLVVAPTLPVGDLQAVLQRTRLQIVDSSVDGALLGLVPQPGNRAGTAQSLAALRKENGVLLAEPMPPAGP